MTVTVKPNQTAAKRSAPKPEAGQSARTAPTKSELVKKLLWRGKGATLTELQYATDWQPPSVRAFLSGLRKKGKVLVKEERKYGETGYRIAGGKVAAGPADA
jgi:hypothetical protein